MRDTSLSDLLMATTASNGVIDLYHFVVVCRVVVSFGIVTLYAWMFPALRLVPTNHTIFHPTETYLIPYHTEGHRVLP
jgi:hypothetical protein